MAIVTPKLSRVAQLTSVKTAKLDGGTLRLFKNDVTPTPDTLLADLTLADFSGYANVTMVTWGTPFTDIDGKATSLGTLATFARAAGGVSNTVYGAYYLDSVGALVFAERFAAAVQFANVGDTAAIVPKYQFGLLG